MNYRSQTTSLLRLYRNSNRFHIYGVHTFAADVQFMFRRCCRCAHLLLDEIGLWIFLPLFCSAVCFLRSVEINKKRPRKRHTHKESRRASGREPFMNYNLMTAVSSSCLFSTIFRVIFVIFAPLFMGFDGKIYYYNERKLYRDSSFYVCEFHNEKFELPLTNCVCVCVCAFATNNETSTQRTEHSTHHFLD